MEVRVRDGSGLQGARQPLQSRLRTSEGVSDDGFEAASMFAA